MASGTLSIQPPAGVAAQEQATVSLTQYVERLALRFAIGVGVLIGALVLIGNWNRNPVPLLVDRQGFGVITLFVTPVAVAVAAAWAHVLGVRARNARVAAEHQRAWGYSMIPIGLAYGAVVALLIVVLLSLVDRAFQDLQLALLQGTAIAVLVAGSLSNWAIKQAASSSSTRLLELAIIIIAGGIYLTATQVENPEWWRVSFSYLGSLKSNANTIFNVTLVFGGLLLIAWMPYFLSDLRVLIRSDIAQPRALTWLRVGMWWLAVGVALVGIFKTQSTPFSSIVHNLAAYSLAGVFGLLMLGLKWLIPGISKEVLALTWIMLGGLAVTMAMAAFGYINTVGLEVIAFSLGIMWLQALVRGVASSAQDLEPAGYPR